MTCSNAEEVDFKIQFAPLILTLVSYSFYTLKQDPTPWLSLPPNILFPQWTLTLMRERFLGPHRPFPKTIVYRSIERTKTRNIHDDKSCSFYRTSI